MNILELDAGNTRLKWRLLKNGSVTDRGFVMNSESWATHLPAVLAGLDRIDRARASVVSGSERTNALITVLKEQTGVTLETVMVSALSCGVSVAYKNARTLGVDRWLAMLAAHHQKQRCDKLIVDSGTALTIDLVDRHGQHLGGYVVPGLGLMKKALNVNTAHLEMIDDPATSIVPGVESMACINNGVLSMAVAMINTQCQRMDNPVVFLTGGDADQLQPYISSTVYSVPELVMDGLSLACEEC